MYNFILFFIAILFIYLVFFYQNQSNPKEITVDLTSAHHIINHIGLDSTDDLFTSQIKQLFLKNKKVTPDMIDHIAQHYQIPSCHIYRAIHEIISQPLKC